MKTAEQYREFLKKLKSYCVASHNLNEDLCMVSILNSIEQFLKEDE